MDLSMLEGSVVGVKLKFTFSQRNLPNEIQKAIDCKLMEIDVYCELMATDESRNESNDLRSFAVWLERCLIQRLFDEYQNIHDYIRLFSRYGLL